MKPTPLPTLQQSLDWRQGYWLGLAVGGLADTCSGVIIGILLKAL